MIVRVQSRDGTKRIPTSPSNTLQQFLDKVISEFKLTASASFSLYCSPGYRDELTTNHLQHQLQHIPIHHGSLLYLLEDKAGVVGGAVGGATESRENGKAVKEDEVDVLLSQQDGVIHRDRDPQLCRHGPGNKCINCVPLDPWDPRYLQTRDPPIKHISFHSHIRKLTSGVDRGKFAYLEDLSCRVKAGCTDHAPWPAGICTKCQPSAITLARQPYRHVDNVMFDDGKLVDRFIEGWRRTGEQRVGFLLGRYTEYTDVPLGIRATVSAIYEPPQVCGKFSVELLEDERASQVQELASLLGLTRVGWIFTDLEPEQQGKVAYKRSVHTHLLSAEECIMAADLQNRYPNTCRLSKTGFFGSKFVTVCVSGNASNQIDLVGYQVSNQCMALVRDDCLVPTLDAPELGYIRESTPEQYVPDVFYSTKDQYGQVTRLARPLPLEYLIIEVTTSTPLKPAPFLPGGGGRGQPFPVENRDVQDFNAVAAYTSSQHGCDFLSLMADFHLLYYLATCSDLGIDFKGALPELCKAIREGDKRAAEKWRRSDVWATVEQLIHASAPSPTTLGAPPVFPSTSVAMDTGSVAASGSGQWACKHCTLLNPAHRTDCEVCHLPRS